MSTTMAHAIAAIGPYDFYMLVLSTFAIAVLAADWMLTLSPAMHDVLETTDAVLCALFFIDFVRNMIKASSRGTYFLKGRASGSRV
jgi:voltage-gated potassium channel